MSDFDLPSLEKGGLSRAISRSEIVSAGKGGFEPSLPQCEPSRSPKASRFASGGSRPPFSREGGLSRPQIAAAARAWIGTPYVHQAAAKGQGTDCLGLIRGLYAELYGAEPEAPPPYTPDWNEAHASEEPLLSAAKRHLAAVSAPHPKVAERLSASPRGGGEEGSMIVAPASLHLPLAGRSKPRSGFGWGPCFLSGQVLIFRIMTNGPAKHCGVAVGADRFVHAYAGRAVIESWLSRWWIERLAGVFDFPGVEG